MKAVHFMLVFWKSLYQAAIIFVLASTLFENSFIKVITISFSALVFTELLNVFTLVDRLNVWIASANAISLIFYLISVIFFRDLMDLQEIDWDMAKKIFIIVLVCWAPFEIIKGLNRYFFPTASDKIMSTVLRKEGKWVLAPRGLEKDDSDRESNLLSPRESK